MSDKEIKLNGDEVISLHSRNDQLLVQHPTFRVDELKACLRDHLRPIGKWLAQGVDCEVLYPGGLWKEGKVRICIGFCPNESEIIDLTISSEDSNSELDEIRQLMNGES